VIRGMRPLVLKIRWTMTLPQVCATVLPPLRGLSSFVAATPRLAPWAAFLRSFAAGVGRVYALVHTENETTDSPGTPISPRFASDRRECTIIKLEATEDAPGWQ